MEHPKNCTVQRRGGILGTNSQNIQNLEIILKIGNYTDKNYMLTLEFSLHIYIFHYTQFYTQFEEQKFLP